MTVRVKVRVDKKAMIRFGDQIEEQWFINLIRSIRDSDPKTHPEISIKNKNGEIPKLPPPKPIPPGKAAIQESAIPPEILEKMKKEKEIKLKAGVKKT